MVLRSQQGRVDTKFEASLLRRLAGSSLFAFKGIADKTMIRLTLLAVLFFALVAIVSGVTSYLIIKNMGYVRFVPEPRPNNPDYGFFQVSGNRYYQVWTTTEIKDKGTPPGTHLHGIDIRSENQ